MDASPMTIAHELLPLLRQFCRGEYGIALGGAHAKGAADPESDVDLYVFARQVAPGPERDRLCAQFSDAVTSVISWSDGSPFVQGGTDFHYDQRRVEVWLRNTDYVSSIIADCKAGVVKRDYVMWTVMGFYYHCTLSDLYNMVPVDDPAGILAHWKTEVNEYPPRLRQTIIATHMGAAKFWPENIHYQTAAQRCDIIYVTGIVQQVVQHLIQVVFALNRVYFPGEKKLEAALGHLDAKPADFAARIKWLVNPAVSADCAFLDRQRKALGQLVNEVDGLVAESRRSTTDGA